MTTQAWDLDADLAALDAAHLRRKRRVVER